MTFTAEDLAACNAATAASGCQAIDAPFFECRFHGSLPGGAHCVLPLQCRSGFRDGTPPPDGGRLWGPCGTCRDVASIGETCGDDAGCERGAVCLGDLSKAPLVQKCIAVKEEDAGAECNAITVLCKPGMYCSASRICTPFPTLGEPCEIGRCAAPYVCGLDHVCKKAASFGEDCYPTCEPGLGCVRGTCKEIEWRDPGEPCDETHACLSDECQAGVCPHKAVDGEPCGADYDCAERFASCAISARGATRGVCSQPATVACH